MEKRRALQAVLLLLIVRDVFSQEVQVCSKTSINSCDDCIKSGPYCVWCKQKNFTKTGETETARCDTVALLKTKGCPDQDIISPENFQFPTQNKPLTDVKPEPIQLKPQALTLKLRPGLPETFKLEFSRVKGYPVDLYYLMDLSFSMKDDLENVKGLGEKLFEALQRITDDAQIGFGTFVDKTVLPFTNTNKDKLNHPCNEDQTCAPAFGFRHVVSLTNDQRKFQAEVKKVEISGNLDSPEGSLDAVMQAAVCEKEIGWRNHTRLLVLTTDAGFHMAGDGKLAGILEPNDERCWLENQLYAKSNEMDYPSVGQVAMQLENRNIQPIFAVTSTVSKVYEDLIKLIPKSAVGVLDSDSKNVVQLIEAAYKNLSSTVIVSHTDLPDKVKVTYRSNCRSRRPLGGDKGECENVAVGEKISFDVTVTAEECMDKKMTFFIGPQGIKDKLTVTVETRCACECDDLERKSPDCGGKGDAKCGMCSCDDGFVGSKCECAIGQKEPASLKAQCLRTPNSTLECEGHGDCQCGECQCRSMEGGGGNYYGTHCECDDAHCNRHNNLLCGGNGDCKCGTCKCHAGYQGDQCECVISDEQCRTGASVCHGRGKCKCASCECVDEYQRPFCELRGDSICKRNETCIECLGFVTGPFAKNCSKHCPGIEKTMVDTLQGVKNPCKVRDVEGCWLYFTIAQHDSVPVPGTDKVRHFYTAKILKTRECPEPPPIAAIIAGSVLGALLIGILILCLIKGLIYMSDLKEFRKFQSDQRNVKWGKEDNALYRKPITNVVNPLFTGE